MRPTSRRKCGFANWLARCGFTTMRLYHDWQNPAPPDERLQAFLRKHIPPRVTENMLQAP